MEAFTSPIKKAELHAIFTRELPAWYMLAGGLRNYALDLPAEACGASRVAVEVETEATVVRASAGLPQRPCAP